MANEKSNSIPSSEFSNMAMNAVTAAKTSSKGVSRLLAVGKEIVLNPKFQPVDGKTFCNCAVAYAVSTLCQYNKLFKSVNVPLTANDIFDVLSNDTANWKKVTASDAWDAALQGKVAIAAQKEDVHGHVALVSPGPRTWSQKWSAYFPYVFNVGKTMNSQPPYTIGENYAFLERPTHFVYVG